MSGILNVILSRSGSAARTLGSAVSVSGTKIGNLTVGGGLAAAFDGTTSQAGASTAAANSLSVSTGYVGVTLGSLTRLFQCVVHGGNDSGYENSGNPSITLEVYGKTTSPASATDGTLIGSATFTDTADERAARTITMSDNETQWNYVWVRVVGGTNPRVAELIPYQSV